MNSQTTLVRSCRRRPDRRQHMAEQLGTIGLLCNRCITVLLAAVMAFGIYTRAGAQSNAQSVKPAPMRIVAFGDSLTAGFGLKPGQAFPDVLQIALRARGHEVEVINAGVSGDTTAAGLQRFEWAIPENADGVILELGANDALRGQPVTEARANLDAILKRLKSRGVPVLLAGMRSPENWGPDYRAKFDAMFPSLAQQHGAILYPFFLDGVAIDRTLNLDDGLHPNAKGIAVIVGKILPYAEQLLERAAARRPAQSGGHAGKS